MSRLRPSPPPGALPPLPPLFAALPPPFAELYDAAAPWALLGEALDAVLARICGAAGVSGSAGVAGSAGRPEKGAIETEIPAGVHLAGDGIAIGSGTRIHPGAVLEGPLWVGRDVEIRPGAYVRGGAWIGDGCVVGASTEIKRAILLPGARAPHLNYVGDSILGAGVNLGAGTILSNFRHDGGEVRIAGGGAPGGRAGIATGRRKLGAVLGDGVLTGCNCVLHPGVVVGSGTQIYPGVQLRSGVYPEGMVIKLRQAIEMAPLAGAPPPR